MKTTLTAVLLLALAALGILNVGQSIRNHFLSHDEASEKHVVRVVQSTSDETMIDETFKVRPGGLLDVAVGHADVEIKTTDGTEARVVVTLSARDMEKGREFFESRNFEVRQDGNRIVVKTNPRKGSWSWNSGRVDIDVDISIPAEFNADIAMSHGDLEAGPLQGNLDLKSSHGDVEVAEANGEYFKIKLSHGDVEVGRVSARTVELMNSHGDLEVGMIAAEDISARSSHGDMALGIKEARSMDITNAHGEVELAMSSPVGGSIRNSHGDIDIEMHDGTAMTLDLQGSHVSVGSSMNFSGTATSEKIEGTLNGGGPLLKARTSHGSIDIGT